MTLLLPHKKRMPESLQAEGGIRFSLKAGGQAIQPTAIPCTGEGEIELQQHLHHNHQRWSPLRNGRTQLRQHPQFLIADPRLDLGQLVAKAENGAGFHEQGAS